MPLVGYHPIGFTREPLSYGRVDHRMIPTAEHRERVRLFFLNSPHRFNLIFLNCHDKEKFYVRGDAGQFGLNRLLRDVGEANSDEFPHRRHRIWKLINPDAINFLFVNNRTGDPQIPMTPWMIAHRMSHVPLLHSEDRMILLPLLYWNAEILKNCYDYRLPEALQALNHHSQIEKDEVWFRSYSPWYGTSPDLRVFHGLYIGMTTSRAARTKQLRPSECVAEWFAQFILYGEPRFGPLPEVIDCDSIPESYTHDDGKPLEIPYPSHPIEIVDRNTGTVLERRMSQQMQLKFHEILRSWHGKLIIT